MRAAAASPRSHSGDEDRTAHLHRLVCRSETDVTGSFRTLPEVSGPAAFRDAAGGPSQLCRKRRHNGTAGGSRRRCGRGEPSPGADVGGVRQSRWRGDRGEPSPGAHVAAASSGAHRRRAAAARPSRGMAAAESPDQVPAQTWQRVPVRPRPRVSARRRPTAPSGPLPLRRRRPIGGRRRRGPRSSWRRRAWWPGTVTTRGIVCCNTVRSDATRGVADRNLTCRPARRGAAPKGSAPWCLKTCAVPRSTPAELSSLRLTAAVPAQMWAKSWRRCGHSPGADVGKVPAQMWAKSRRRCGQSRGADVGTVPAQTWPPPQPAARAPAWHSPGADVGRTSYRRRCGVGAANCPGCHGGSQHGERLSAGPVGTRRRQRPRAPATAARHWASSAVRRRGSARSIRAVKSRR